MKEYRIFAGKDIGGGETEFYVFADGFKDALKRVLETVSNITDTPPYNFEDGSWWKNWESYWKFPHRRWDGPDGYQIHVQDPDL